MALGVAIMLMFAFMVEGAAKRDFHTGKLTNIDFEETLIKLVN